MLSSLGGAGAGVDWIPAPVCYTDWKLDGDSGTQQDITDGAAVGFKGGTEAGGAGIVTEANQPAGKNITISLTSFYILTLTKAGFLIKNKIKTLFFDG